MSACGRKSFAVGRKGCSIDGCHMPAGLQVAPGHDIPEPVNALQTRGEVLPSGEKCGGNVSEISFGPSISRNFLPVSALNNRATELLSENAQKLSHLWRTPLDGR